MVTNFVEASKPKSKKIGPHFKAYQYISNAVSQSQSLKKRKQIGRRTGSKGTRQKRDIHIIRRSGSDIVGTFLYYNWGNKSSLELKLSINKDNTNELDISTFTVIDNVSPNRHTVVLDGDNSNEFIFTKVTRTQCNECLGGRQGLNKIRDSFQKMKQLKPNQSRGHKTMGLSTSYKLFGYRKDYLTNKNGEYVFKSNNNVPKDQISNISSFYSNLSYNMEMAARRIGDSFYETGVYEYIQTHCNVPAVGVQMLSEDYKKKKSFATALAIGENYWSKSHIDNDFYFTSLSVLSNQSIDNNKILYYFVFSLFKVMVPMSSGDVLLFNPAITHSCSNPSISDSYIFSSYMSRKTVITAEANMDCNIRQYS